MDGGNALQENSLTGTKTDSKLSRWSGPEATGNGNFADHRAVD